MPFEDLFAKKETKAGESRPVEPIKVPTVWFPTPNPRFFILHAELEQLAAGRTEDNIPVTERAYWDKRNEILTFKA